MTIKEQYSFTSKPKFELDSHLTVTLFIRANQKNILTYT